MLPDFDSEGDLPPGIHRGLLADFEARFSRFTASDRRVRLMAILNRLLAMARASGIVEQVFVGGSFVTAKAAPNDLDLIMVVSREIDVSALTPSQYNLTRRSALRRLLKTGDLDVTVVKEGSQEARVAIEFFQTNRDNKLIGVVEVEF